MSTSFASEIESGALAGGRPVYWVLYGTTFGDRGFYDPADAIRCAQQAPRAGVSCWARIFLSFEGGKIKGQRSWDQFYLSAPEPEYVELMRAWREVSRLP